MAASDAADEGIGGELTIQPDALLMVRVQEDSQLNGTYAVNSMGAIDLGYVGPVFLFNKNEREAERKIADVLKLRHFNKATVSVRMLRPSFDQVRVTGDVNNPGIIKIGPSDSITLRDLLLRAGGVEGSAKRARVKVIRDGLLSPVAYSLEGEDYRLVAEDGSPFIPEVFLRNNDLVHVSTAPAAARKASPGVSPKTVLVLGEVKKRGFVRFGPGEPATMLRLLFKQGGLPPYAKAKAVRVIRRHDDGFEEEFVVNAREILEEGDPDDDFALEDGDRVIVPARRISLF